MMRTKYWNNSWTRSICRWLAQKTRATRLTPPHLEIKRDGQPYLHRWYIIPRNPLFNIYLHKFVNDDIDEAFHDHPWWSLSFMLSSYGGTEYYYQDNTYVIDTRSGKRISNVRSLDQGDVIFRSAGFAHRIELQSKRPIVTLFITGPRFREWGFLCQNGWKPWTQYHKDGGC